MAWPHATYDDDISCNHSNRFSPNLFKMCLRGMCTATGNGRCKKNPREKALPVTITECSKESLKPTQIAFDNKLKTVLSIIHLGHYWQSKQVWFLYDLTGNMMLLFLQPTREGRGRSVRWTWSKPLIAKNKGGAPQSHQTLRPGC